MITLSVVGSNLAVACATPLAEALNEAKLSQTAEDLANGRARNTQCVG